MQFLATATGVAIQQHTEDAYADDSSFCNLLVYPCCAPQRICTINIMWVRFTTDCREVNHLVPLFPQGIAIILASDIAQYQNFIDGITAKMVDAPDVNTYVVLARSVKDICVMLGAHQCMVNHLHGEEIVEWIQCSICHCWYHCVCVGIEEKMLPNFVCCNATQDHVYVMSSWYVRTYVVLSFNTSCRMFKCGKMELSFFDIKSLYPNRGVSDRIIDFFVW